jgi:hypothetical protein
MFSKPAVRLSPAVFAWLPLGALVNIVFPTDVATLMVSALGLVHSAIAFLAHGGSRISIPGVYLLGTGLFVYFPGIYLSIDPTVAPLPYLLAAVNVCYFGQILSYYLFWKPTEVAARPRSEPVDPRVALWGRTLGMVLVISGTMANLLVFEDTPIMIDSVVFTGTVLMAVATFRAPRRLTPLDYFLVGAAFVSYVVFVFDGFGRLNVGALGIAIAIAMIHRWRGRIVKAAVLLALTPVISILAASRVIFSAALNPDQGPGVTGLESVVSPLFRFAELLDLESGGRIPEMQGSSFFAAMVVLVPRALWPQKPIGLGAELAQFFRPDLVGSGHSEAALFHGEWLLNFGVAGLVLMVPIIALLISWLDRAMVKALARPTPERRQLLTEVAMVLIAAGMVDLVWGGAFTYTSRAGTRLLVVLAIFLLFAWRARRGPVESESARLARHPIRS